ncbi:MAG: hypothetical protein BJ554DRAFT_6229 [Olpidium bornovanus]|uniref:Uncharacterized protein n=1 Tax=Olpidium bornovanus TaxID=278681 RepID=A0A8H8DKC5_9FUNG|nr:MAG: hypothetical protein BJ554DRAFT_6229 [Olpidium bornovanus]
MGAMRSNKIADGKSPHASFIGKNCHQANHFPFAVGSFPPAPSAKNNQKWQMERVIKNCPQDACGKLRT